MVVAGTRLGLNVMTDSDGKAVAKIAISVLPDPTNQTEFNAIQPNGRTAWFNDFI
jgi:hypothetical protein